jgi:Asp-tRNA(Asn)/Glu-tRNA(Gln) amidotransferase C subunit
MKLDRDEAKALAKSVGLVIPEDELVDVTRRLESLLTVMEEVEAKIGHLLDDTDPIPPVFPREDF